MTANDDYQVPEWLYEQDENSIRSLLQSLGSFVADGLEDTVQTAKATLQVPLMLHNIMLAEIMQVGLLQRQNDMINETQEQADTDLLNFSQAALNGQVSVITYQQAMRLQSFTCSNNGAAVNLTFGYFGPHTFGNNVIIMQQRYANGTIFGMSGLNQVIPPGSTLFLLTNASSTIYLTADIRPIKRYKDYMYRTFANRTGF